MTIPVKHLVAALCITAAPLQAHEFWIEPQDYTVQPGTPVIATFRNGENFAGSALSWIPGRSERFDMIVGDTVTAVPVRIGDNPAFDMDDLPEGLLTIVHETTDSDLTYREKAGRSGWDRFAGFAEHKDLGDVATAQDARGLSRAEPTERYRRFVKALVAVGDGAGSDANRGLRTEIVAEANPYVDDLSGGLPVQVFLDGAPKADAQIEMFSRGPDDAVEVTVHRADGEGRAMLPVVPGRSYLLDSVSILPLEGGGDGVPDWQTLWAALTFAVPGT